MQGVPDAITLWIEGLPPNPNQTKRNHWAKNYQEGQTWKELAFYTAKQAYKGRPLERASIHYQVSVGDNRRHDADNLIASLKQIQDGLVGVIIKDDDIDHIAVSYAFDRAKPRGVGILVFELDALDVLRVK